MSPKTVLVTGGTGFIGSHIISQLLETDYIIRATARSAKKLRSVFPDASPSKLEIIEMPGLDSDHTEALKGVYALIHCATPAFIQSQDNVEILNGAYHGAIDIITTAIKIGIPKIIYTSSMVALFEVDFSNGFGKDHIGPESWGSIPLEKIDVSETSPGPMYVYQTAKTAAEKKIWELADEIKDKDIDIDITTILPSVVLGPFVPNFPLTSSASSMSTNSFILNLLDSPTGSLPKISLGHIVDVRDVAHHHILALDTPPLPNGEHKRLISNNKSFTWGEVVKVIREKYVEAGDEEFIKRLPSPDATPVVQVTVPLDDSLTRKILEGFGEYLPFEKTVLDTFDAVLDWEKRYKK